MITKQDILTSSAVSRMLARDGKVVDGVLSLEKYREWRANHPASTSIQAITSGDHGVFFYTDDYCLGINIPEMNAHGFVPSSTGFPMSVKARPGLESGWISTLEEFEFIFHKDHRRLETIEELLEILNGPLPE